MARPRVFGRQQLNRMASSSRRPSSAARSGASLHAERCVLSTASGAACCVLRAGSQPPAYTYPQTHADGRFSRRSGVMPRFAIRRAVVVAEFSSRSPVLGRLTAFPFLSQLGTCPGCSCHPRRVTWPRRQQGNRVSVLCAIPNEGTGYDYSSWVPYGMASTNRYSNRLHLGLTRFDDPSAELLNRSRRTMANAPLNARRHRLQLAIEGTEDGYFHLRTVLILGLGNAADAIEILSIGYILAVYEDKEGALTRAEQSVLAAAIFAGMFLGGLVFGLLSDHIGRRASLLHSLLINAVFALLSSISPNIYVLVLCRTFAGIGIGGTVPAMFTLCTEHVPANRRGFYVTIVASYWMVGSVFTAALAWVMLGNPASPFSWRAFAAVVSIPAFVCWILTYYYVPESAQYYARRRKYTDAEDIVNHIRLTNATRSSSEGKNIALGEGTALLSPYRQERVPVVNASFVNTDAVEHVDHDKSYGAAYRDLFDPVLRTTTVSLLLSWFCLSFGSYGLATWITVLFKRINLSDPFANAFIYAAANLPGNLYSAFLMDSWGGRRILFISMLLSALCAAGFAYVNSNNDEEVSITSTVLIITLASGFNAFSTAGWNAIDLMSAESFPTDIRTTGMGLLAAAGRSGSVIAQFVNGYLVGPPPHITALLVVTASMMLLGSISSVAVKDYTGKSLPASVEQMKKDRQVQEQSA